MIDDNEILDNLKEQLQNLRLELESLRKEHFTPKEEVSPDELRLQLKARDEQIENLKNFATIYRKFAEEEGIQLKVPIVNKSNEFIEVQEDENGVDGHSFRVVKKILPQNKEMDIVVKGNTVSKRGLF